MVRHPRNVGRQLERKGIRPERLRLEWVSAAEGQKWAQLMRDLEELRKTVTREEVEETIKMLRQKERKGVKRKA